MPNDADDNTRAPTSQMKLTRPLPAAGPSLESVSHCGRSERACLCSAVASQADSTALRRPCS